MRLRIASDLHFEFHADGGVSLTRELAQGDFEALVVAGDLSSCPGLCAAVITLCQGLAPRPVVYVFGNHELYGGTLQRARQAVQRASRVAENLVFLEQSSASVGGRRFVGCTLWYPHSGRIEPLDQNMADFSEIRGIRRWLPQTAADSARFLAASVCQGDIVVTHHLPYVRSVAPQFAANPLNRYFLHDLSELVQGGEAALWVHGHTHASCDYQVGKTRVVCNPFGYARLVPGEPNRDFCADFDVEVR